jgi:hypothetical protein
MDVHPPHGPMHSWKDFWVHLGTITIGLLIALALEAGVEKIHQLHQRHQLEEDLRAEGERGLTVVEGDQRILAAERVWLLAWRNQVDRMVASGGKTRVPYPAHESTPKTMPSDAVWATARESSLVALLPRSEATVYARLYRQHDLLQGSLSKWQDVEMELDSFQNKFEDGNPTSVPDVSSMTVEQLKEYSTLLTRSLTSRQTVNSRLDNFRVVDEAVLAGAVSEEGLIDKLGAALAIRRKGAAAPASAPATPHM